MKALKSQLAEDLLADEQARNALRRVLLSNRSLSSKSADRPIKLRRGAATVMVSVTMVPKAKVD